MSGDEMPMLGIDSTIMRGRVVGADFFSDLCADDEVIVHVAVPAGHSIGKSRVVVIEESYFDSTLPTWDDVRGSIG